MFTGAMIFSVSYFLLVDSAWIYTIVLPLYQRTLPKEVLGQPNIAYLILSACIVYSVLLLGLFHLASPRVRDTSWLHDSLLWGGVYGLVTYAVYSATNLAVFRDWSLSLLVTDILWGTWLCASTLCLYHAALRQ